MTEQEKLKAALRLVEAVVGGYSSHEEVQPAGLTMEAWKSLFKNCYQAVEEMIMIAEAK